MLGLPNLDAMIAAAQQAAQVRADAAAAAAAQRAKMPPLSAGMFAPSGTIAAIQAALAKPVVVTDDGGGDTDSSGTTPVKTKTAEELYWEGRAAADAAAADNARNQQLETMRSFLNNNGMGSLFGGVEALVRKGYTDSTTIMDMLAKDPAYQKAYDDRFKGNVLIREKNKERAANGQPLLAEHSAATYIALEKAYATALTGLPTGTFGTADDIATWMANQVSAQEVTDRVTQAKNYIAYNANDAVKQQLRGIYGMSDVDMVTYVLDPIRTVDGLKNEYQRRLANANVGGAAATKGVTISDLLRDEIAQTQYGTTYDMAAASMQNVSNESNAYMRLAALSNQDATQEDLVREAFGLQGASEAAFKKKNLASQERARFTGNTGVMKSSLSAGRLAQ